MEFFTGHCIGYTDTTNNVAEGLNRELKEGKPAGKMTFLTTIKYLHEFEQKKRLNLAEYIYGVTPAKNRPKKNTNPA